MNTLAAKHDNLNSHQAITKNTLGKCCYSIRTVFVRECAPRGGYVTDRVPMKRKRWYKWIKRQWNYAYQKRVLVEELVHYRFPYLDDGTYALEKRINEVLRGRTFEPKHTHLFAGYSKAYRQHIDG